MEASEQKILQKHLAQFLIVDVFNTISEDDILKVNAPGMWTNKGDELTPGQINALKGEAKVFANSNLWKFLKAELLWQAREKGFVKAKTENDLIAGKLLEYLTDVVDSKLKRMAEN